MKHVERSAAECGLTLLELLVVLVILATLATVAVTSTTGFADQARYEATQRTLTNVRDAILGPQNLRDSDGTTLRSGFVSDLGRLPRAASRGNVFTLRELRERPDGTWGLPSIQPYAVRRAVLENVDDPAEVDPDVYLGSGWRGPYLQLPPGELLLRDGWGSELILRTTGSAAITAVGQEVGLVYSFGSNPDDGEKPADDGYKRDLFVAASTGEYQAQISVTVQLCKPNGELIDTTTAVSRKVVVRLFAPDPDTGLLKVTPVDLTSETATFVFDPLLNTVGLRAIRAYLDGSSNKSDVVMLTLLPEHNARTLIITVR